MSDKERIKMSIELSRDKVVEIVEKLLTSIKDSEVAFVDLCITACPHSVGKFFEMQLTPKVLKDRTEGQSLAVKRLKQADFYEEPE